QFLDTLVDRGEAAVVAHLEHALGGASCGEDPPRVIERGGHGLFAEDGFAAGERAPGEIGMRGGGRGGVDSNGAVEEPIETCGWEVAAAGWIDIVDGGDLGARIAAKVCHVQAGGVPGSRDSNTKLHRMASSVSVSNRWIFSGRMRNQNGSPEFRRTPAGAR